MYVHRTICERAASAFRGSVVSLVLKQLALFLTSPRYHDPAPALTLCVEAQSYYSKQAIRTQVLPASLTSVKECLTLAGADHITIAPLLLRELAAMPFEEGRVGVPADFPSLFDGREGEIDQRFGVAGRSKAIADSEGDWRIWFTRAKGGRAETKLIDAVNIFCDMQIRLEDLISRYI